MGVNANPLLNAPLLHDARTADLEAELNKRRMGDAIMRDASTSELEMILAAVHDRRVHDAATPAEMQIMDVTDEEGAAGGGAVEDDELLGVD